MFAAHPSAAEISSRNNAEKAQLKSTFQPGSLRGMDQVLALVDGEGTHRENPEALH